MNAIANDGTRPGPDAAGPKLGWSAPKGPLLSLFGISVVSNLLMLTGPLFMLQVYDRVLASRSVPTLVALTVLVCALYALYAFIEALRARMGARFGSMLEQSIGERLLAASIRFRLMGSAAAGADPVRDGDTLRQFVSGGGPLAIFDLPWLPIYMALVFFLHPALGWLATGGGAIIVVLMVLNEWLARKPALATSSALSARQRQAEANRANAETIIGMGMLADMQRLWREASEKLLLVQQSASDRAVFFSSATKGLRFLLQSAVLALGAYLVILGQLSGGLMIASSIITSRALAPVEQVVAQWRSFVAARQAFHRIGRTLEAVPASDRDTELLLPRASLVVRQLSSGPPAGRVLPLTGVTLELAAGEALGVLGPSGAGKSSLARVLTGIWPVAAGELRLDGAALAHYRADQLGRIIGYLPQRVELFDGTVAQNIARFRENAPSEAIIAAARAAGVHDLIQGLPNGYDTQIGEQGDMLSAGQKQRTALARALFGQPFLIVLDEPNSNLDADGDNALTDAIMTAKAWGAVVVVVAHRPSAITAVDKIVYLKAGRQLAFGPKDEVLRQITQQNAGDNVRPIKQPGTA